MNLRDLVLGRPLSSLEEEGQKVGVVAGIPILGLDALSSAAYGPEAAMTILLPVGAIGIGYVRPISAVIIAILLIVYVSYLQTIGAYPGGGGSFTGIAFAVPTYAFVVCLFLVLAIGVVKVWASNGRPVPVVAPPARPTVRNARRTLTAIIAVLVVLLAGITYLSNVYHIGATDTDSRGDDEGRLSVDRAVPRRGIP